MAYRAATEHQHVRRYSGPSRGVPRPGRGVTVEPLVAPNPLWGSNGIAFGPDGRLWIVQFAGGTVSALDTATGRLGTVIGPDGPLVGPDDIAVDPLTGAVYIVDLPPGLVWRRDPDATLRIVADGISAPDGIAVHNGRLFVNELVYGGRLLEIDQDGGPPRVLATDLALGNAMAVGPDGLLYYPHLMTGEVWRVAPDGGTPRRVVGGLGTAVAARFDNAGRLLVLSIDEVGTLHVVDPESGSVRRVTTGVAGGDNIAVAADGTLYLSSAFRGGLVRRRPDGHTDRPLPEGFVGPSGITATPRGGLAVADHYTVVGIGADGAHRVLGFPGRGSPIGMRGIAERDGWLYVSTEFGQLHASDPDGRWAAHRDDLADPHGMAAVADGLLVTEGAAGRVRHLGGDGTATVLAEGLGRPVDVTVDADGTAYAADTDRGQVVRLRDGAVLAAGLHRPQGLAALRGDLWCLEAGTGSLHRIDPRTRTRRAAVEDLPLAVLPGYASAAPGAGVGTTRPEPFAALVVQDGALVAGTSGDGGILRIRVA